MSETSPALIVILVLAALGGGGWLFYSNMYTPAKDALVTAEASLQTADASLAEAESKLQIAEQKRADALAQVEADDDAVAEVLVSQRAIPADSQIGEAVVELRALADQAGLDLGVNVDATDLLAEAAEGGSSGARPVDLSFTGTGTMSQLQLYLQSVAEIVDDEKGTAYVGGRLYNVMQVQYGTVAEGEQDDSDTSGFEFSGGFGEEPELEEDALPKGHHPYKIIVRMYVQPGGGQDTGLDAIAGDPTLDPAAAGGIDPETGQPVDPNAASGGASGAPGTPGAPAAAGAPAPGTPGAPGTDAATGAQQPAGTPGPGGT